MRTTCSGDGPREREATAMYRGGAAARQPGGSFARGARCVPPAGGGRVLLLLLHVCVDV